MKNKTLLLAKTLIKNGEGIGLKGSTAFAKAVVILVFLIIIPMFMSGIAFVVAALLGMLRQIGQEGIILTWGLAINSAVVFIFGIFYIISTFYFSSDIELLLPLPLKPRQIIGAKFIVVAVYEYLTTAVVFVPMWLTYGIKMGSGLLYYVYGLIIFLLIPFVPLTAASILIMLIMRFFNLSRHKDTVKVVGGMLGIFIGLGINVVVQNVTTGMSQEQVMELIQKGNNSLIGLAAGIFPTTRWGAEALVFHAQLSGFISFLLYTGFSILFYYALLWLGELIYLRGVIGLSEAGSRRNRTKQVQLEKTAVKGSVIRTYTLVELKLLFRTPIYFINCVMINFLYPVFFLFPLLVQNEEVSIIQELSKALNKPGTEGMILAGSFALALFLGGTNATTATAISREGQELFVKKYLPVSYRQQLTAKLLSGFILGLVAIIMMVLFAVIVFNLEWWLGLIILATAWLPILYTSLTGLLIDLYNPKLDWDNEQKAVKQNVNVVYNMLAGILPAGLTIAFIGFAFNLVWAIIVLVGFYGLLSFILAKLLYTIGVKRFCMLEG
ncbi:MAG TPA: hypothetical protein GX505_01515 [Clostridiales bacterium]|nr:hypothetical protein [Clostridiales bacterium]